MYEDLSSKEDLDFFASAHFNLNELSIIDRPDIRRKLKLGYFVSLTYISLSVGES
jgi:hypothetical protein